MAVGMGNAQVLIQNANIITIDQGRPRAQALAIRDGRFLAVGNNDDIADFLGPDTQRLDLQGKTVLPGFIDAHIHVLSSGIRHVMAADCGRPSIPEVLAELRQITETTPDGDWVQGFKYDDTKTAENRFLTRHDLDTISTQHPVMVTHRAGHVSVSYTHLTLPTKA